MLLDEINNMSESTKVIAINFYDGATEGFALFVKNYGACYFKLIAWDSNQDKRLYLVTKIDEFVFIRLLELLACKQKPLSTPVWLPNWVFSNDNDEKQANDIIDSCESNLQISSTLILGTQINSKLVKIIAIFW